MIIITIILIFMVLLGWTLFVLAAYKDNTFLLLSGAFLIVTSSFIGCIIGINKLSEFKTNDEEDKTILQIQGNNINIAYTDANDIIYNQSTGELTFIDSSGIKYSVTPAQ